MLRTTFTDPTENETAEQICWHNLTTGDKYLQLQYIIGASTAWLRLNPTKNYQDLEKVMRDNNLNTHLIAKKIEPVPNMHLGLFREGNDPQDYEYECMFSCRPKEHALKELLEHWSSYEENFNKLLNTGTLLGNDVAITTIKDNPEFKQLNKDEQDTTKLIMDNKKKINIVSVSPEQFLSELMEICEKEYKQKPVEKIVGMAQSGGPIFALFLGDKVVSDVGFVIEHNKEGKQGIRLFDLKQLF